MSHSVASDVQGSLAFWDVGFPCVIRGSAQARPLDDATQDHKAQVKGNP
jgi:hypothetical protein